MEIDAAHEGDKMVTCAVDLFLLERSRSFDYFRRIAPWRCFVEAPIWRHAKPLLDVDADLVNRVMETLVAGRAPGRYLLNGTDELMCLGKVRQAIGEHGRALEVFDYLVGRDDRNYPALYNVALCHIALGDMPKAEAALKRVLEIRPRDTRAAAVIQQHFPASDDAVH